MVFDCTETPLLGQDFSEGSGKNGDYHLLCLGDQDHLPILIPVTALARLP